MSGSFVVIATVKEVVAVGIDGFATFAGDTLKMKRDDREAKLALEHELEDIIWKAAVGLSSRETV